MLSSTDAIRTEKALTVLKTCASEMLNFGNAGQGRLRSYDVLTICYEPSL